MRALLIQAHVFCEPRNSTRNFEIFSPSREITYSKRAGPALKFPVSVVSTIHPPPCSFQSRNVGMQIQTCDGFPDPLLDLFRAAHCLALARIDDGRILTKEAQQGVVILDVL